MTDVLTNSHLEITMKVLRTAYYIAKNDRPYSDHPDLIEFQTLNGSNLGISLHSRGTATTMIEEIALEIETRIQEVNCKIAILVDESTTLSNTTTLIIYMKCEFSKLESPQFLYLELLELFEQSAESITTAILNCLSRNGFDDDYLSENLISFASDGASVMLGKKSSVSTKLLAKYPRLIIWHCLNHRLELSIHDAINEVTSINHFQIFFDKIFSLYSRSSKNQRELAACSQTLEDQLKKIGRILDTRWVASSFRTVSAVWNNFQSLCVHFKKASEDPQRNSKDKSTFLGLLRRMSSPEFIVDLALMLDTLGELSSLSQMLQYRAIAIVSADKLIRRSIRRLEKFRCTSGLKFLEAQEAANSLELHNIQLIHNAKIVPIDRMKFLEILIKRMNDRLFITSFSRSPTATGERLYNTLVNEFNTLNKDSCPITNIPGYGETEIKSMCTRFGLEVAQHVNAFCDYYENLGTHMPSALRPLINCTQLIHVAQQSVDVVLVT